VDAGCSAVRCGDSDDAAAACRLVTERAPIFEKTAPTMTVRDNVAFRIAEDYLIVPRIVGSAVAVPATATVVAVLIGGAVLGIAGALVAIPAAAAAQILLAEIVFPRLDHA
jgi:hypothetical protein